MPFFSKEPYGYFKCQVYSTDTRDLGLKSYPNDMVRRVIKLTFFVVTIFIRNRTAYWYLLYSVQSLNILLGLSYD